MKIGDSMRFWMRDSRLAAAGYWALRAIAATAAVGVVFLVPLDILVSGLAYNHIFFLSAAILVLLPHRLTTRSILFYVRLALILATCVWCVSRALSESARGFSIMSIYFILIAVATLMSLMISRYVTIINTRRRIAAGISIGIVVSVTLVALGFWQTNREASYYQDVLGTELRFELGFGHGSPYHRIGNRVEEVFEFERVVAGGMMDQAGVRDGDIPLDCSFTDFYRMLHKHRGKEVIFEVVAGGDGPPLKKRPKRQIRIVVPED